ncbi:MAG: sigma 54-interacting transcriptional regulator [Bacteroidia bacterium]|nr:sigma 54-interacting transcriptional regulator [Bacteroidia bacterium]
MNLLSIKQRFGIMGNSPKLDHALATAIRVASTDLTVLITGESGVGKEAFSKIIHSLSPRKHDPFIAINCGAIPEGTINSELFGHEKGAFTGATSDRKGYFETVNGGTIFLDEIGEMPLDTQAFLLRILESGEFIKVGSSKVLNTDVRVVAATNISLEDKVRSGGFREDLYYRLSTIPIQVPPLKQRREDVYILFRKFAVDFAEKYRSDPIQIDETARALLMNYSWPGNIRELKNMVEQLSILSDDRLLNSESLLNLVPKLNERNLPAISKQPGGNGMDLNEREILYKLLFDMKNDLNHLKSLVFELIQSNNLQVSDHSSIQRLASPGSDAVVQQQRADLQDLAAVVRPPQPGTPDTTPIILDPQGQPVSDYNRMEVVEESLSLEEMEKDLIKKALKKHKGKRKEAANDLGISERTLYRKIKEYEI